MRAARGIALVGVALFALTAGIGTASADPAATPTLGDTVAVGSDTTQDLGNQFSTHYNAQAPAPASKFYSWDATGGGNIKTKNDPNCTIARPNGTGAGIKQLAGPPRLKAGNGIDYCVDIAGASRNINAGDGPGLVSVLFGQDIITVAEVNGGNGAGATFSTPAATLRAIYRCNAQLLNPAFPVAPVTWAQIGGTGPNKNDAIVPILPLAGSGTRQQFQADIGVPDALLGPCVVNGVFAGTAILENEGTNTVFGNANRSFRDDLFPYSAGVYNCQTDPARPCPNITGGLVLQPIDGKAPIAGNPPALNIGGFTANYIRGLYMVTLNAGTPVEPKVPTPANFGYPVNLALFLGQGDKTGWICGPAAQGDVKTYGFATTRNCGALTGS